MVEDVFSKIGNPAIFMRQNGIKLPHTTDPYEKLKFHPCIATIRFKEAARVTLDPDARWTEGVVKFIVGSFYDINVIWKMYAINKYPMMDHCFVFRYIGFVDITSTDTYFDDEPGTLDTLVNVRMAIDDTKDIIMKYMASHGKDDDVDDVVNLLLSMYDTVEKFAKFFVKEIGNVKASVKLITQNDSDPKEEKKGDEGSVVNGAPITKEEAIEKSAIGYYGESKLYPMFGDEKSIYLPIATYNGITNIIGYLQIDAKILEPMIRKIALDVASNPTDDESGPETPVH